MKILIGVPWIPYPPTDGAKVRAYYLIREVAKRHVVSLFCIRNSAEEIQGLEVFKALCHHVRWVPSTLGYSVMDKCRSLVRTLPFGAVEPGGAVERGLLEYYDSDGFDLVHLQGVEFAGCLEKLTAHRSLVVDLVDCNSLHVVDKARVTGDPLQRAWYLLQARKFRYAEERILANPVTVLVAGRTDLACLLRGPHHADLRTDVLPTGVDVAAPFHQPDAAEPWSVVFTGNMAYYPNEDAVQFFCRRILPVIRNTLPQIRLDVIGKNPSPGLLRLARVLGHVRVTGFMPDLKAEMLRRCLYVCPLRTGTGPKIKLLEAMAAGMPIVSTSIGVDGLSVEDGRHVLLADSADAFAHKVIEALSSVELRRVLGTSARQLVEEHYEWKRIGLRLERIYQDLVLPKPPNS